MQSSDGVNDDAEDDAVVVAGGYDDDGDVEDWVSECIADAAAASIPDTPVM